MADFTIANLATLEAKIAYRVKTMADAVTAVKAGTAAIISAAHGLNDDNGIGDAMRVAAEKWDADLDNLDKTAAAQFVDILASKWQDSATSPADVSSVQRTSFDSWFTNSKATLTNPLMTNELVTAIRAKFGQSAVSAANASAPAAVTAATVTPTGDDTLTAVYVAAPIDTTLYAGALLEALQVHGAASGGTVTTTTATYTLTGVLADGVTPWIGTVTIPSGTAENATVEVVPNTAKTYPVKITAVTGDGMTAAEVVLFRTKTPRTIAA
jgi:hypothetical protein